MDLGDQARGDLPDEAVNLADHQEEQGTLGMF